MVPATASNSPMIEGVDIPGAAFLGLLLLLDPLLPGFTILGLSLGPEGLLSDVPDVPDEFEDEEED